MTVKEETFTCQSTILCQEKNYKQMSRRLTIGRINKLKKICVIRSQQLGLDYLQDSQETSSQAQIALQKTSLQKRELIW
jgi:hypothetical protein